jgi:hypothetical protein
MPRAAQQQGAHYLAPRSLLRRLFQQALSECVTPDFRSRMNEEQPLILLDDRSTPPGFAFGHVLLQPVFVELQPEACGSR